MGITLTYITVTAYSVWKITQAPLPVNHGMVLGASYAIMLYLGYGKQSNSLYVRPKYGISYLRVNKECCFEKHICKLYCTLKPPHDVIFVVSTNISQKQYIHTWISYIYSNVTLRASVSEIPGHRLVLRWCSCQALLVYWRKKTSWRLLVAKQIGRLQEINSNTEAQDTITF